MLAGEDQSNCCAICFSSFLQGIACQQSLPLLRASVRTCGSRPPTEYIKTQTEHHSVLRFRFSSGGRTYLITRQLQAWLKINYILFQRNIKIILNCLEYDSPQCQYNGTTQRVPPNSVIRHLHWRQVRPSGQCPPYKFSTLLVGIQ